MEEAHATSDLAGQYRAKVLALSNADHALVSAEPPSLAVWRTVVHTPKGDEPRAERTRGRRLRPSPSRRTRCLGPRNGPLSQRENNTVGLSRRVLPRTPVGHRWEAARVGLRSFRRAAIERRGAEYALVVRGPLSSPPRSSSLLGWRTVSNDASLLSASCHLR